MYVKDSTGKIVAPFDWTDVAELDYDKPEVRTAMTNALKYWINELILMVTAVMLPWRYQLILE